MDILTGIDMKGVARITGLPNAISDQEPATLAQVNSLVEGLAWKDSVRVATQANISLSAPGATIDGVIMASGDRVLVRSQTAPSQNGIYLWNGSAVAMTRAPDASTSAELEAATVSVEEGTSTGATFRQSTVNFMIETGNVVFGAFGTAAAPASDTVPGVIEIATQAEVDAGTSGQLAVTPVTLKASAFAVKRGNAVIGDGSATQFDIVHNFGTIDVIVQIIAVATGKEVIFDVTRLSTTTVRINAVAAPSANQYRVVIIG